MKWILLLPLALTLAAAPEGFRKYRSKQAIIKSNAPAKAAKDLGKRIDYYCKLFQEFYDELGLDKKNDNILKIRLFDSYDAYEEYYKRGGGGLGGTPLAYFSPSLNSIVMYRDDKDVALRAVVFHECSHQFMNRYTYDAPKWLNEGMAEYFEGWTVDPGDGYDRRPHLYDLSLVKRAIQNDNYLDPKELVEMPAKTFNDFRKKYTKLHGYLHYATSWSLVYHCLNSEHPGDRELLVDYLEQLTQKPTSARFAVEDWDAFTERWKQTVLNLDPEPKSAKEMFLLGAGARENREWKKAIAYYEDALKLEPGLPGAHYAIGYCQKRTGNYAKATATLEAVFEADPEEAKAAYNLARIHLGIDKKDSEPDTDKALRYAEAACKLKPKSPVYLRLLAQCHNARGEHSKARKAAKKILKVIDKDDVELWEPIVEELSKKR